ncbi:MAG: LysR family transcriptional regulator [Burkholderiales bacterium]
MHAMQQLAMTAAKFEDRLTALESFAVVARRLSFVAAAEELGVSASALSRRIRHLEASLQTRLFQRTTRHVSLTEAGTVYLRYVTEALSHIADGEAAVSGYATEPRGRLRIAAPNLFGQLHLAPRLPKFLRRNPQLNLDVSFSDWAVDLVSAGYDVAVRIGVLESSDLVARKLAVVRRVLCASPEYLTRHGRPEDPRELPNHPCLKVSTYPAHNEWRLQGNKKTVDVAISPVIRADNSEALRQAALAGCGIALMPTFVAGEDLKAGRLIQILPDWEAPKSWVWAAYPHARFLPLKVRVFVDFLVAEFGDIPPWDAPRA